MIPTKNRHGLTLIELLVALAIMVILTVASVPLFISLLKKHRLIGTTEGLYAALQYARSEAVKRNTNVYFSFTTGDNWCFGINTGSACNCAVSSSCNLGTSTAPEAQKISLSTTGLTGGSFYFEGTHGAASTSCTVTYTLYGESELMTVSIGRMGSLQICSTGISGYTAC